VATASVRTGASVPTGASAGVGADVRVGADGRVRCGWVGTDAGYERYHDEEWGYPLHGDRELFEKLSLEAFQSGLSWITILRRRDAFRAAFADFSSDIVARFTDDDVEKLMNNSGIIRNRAKILATIANARITTRLVEHDAGALDRLIWSFSPDLARDAAPDAAPDTAPDDKHESPRLRRVSLAELPARTPESAALSAALRKLGYRFVGPTTSYALMQSAGLVDDHLSGCWRTEADSSATTRSSSPATAPAPAPLPLP